MDFANTLATCLALIGSMFTFSPQSEIPYIKTTEPEHGVFIIKINNAPEYDIEPYVAEQLTETQKIYDKGFSRVIINAGFFDPNNGETASYVTINKKVVLDPHTNKSLMSNSALTPYMDRILNRGEFRILECTNGVTKYDIAYHNDAVEKGCEILHSVQAGPILDERMDLEKEYFIAKKDGVVVRDSISATKKVARSAIGIKDGVDIYLFVATDNAPMTIQELSDFMKAKGMKKALAFDGGSSTSFNDGDRTVESIGDGMGRKVKSFLFVRQK